MQVKKKKAVMIDALFKEFKYKLDEKIDRDNLLDETVGKGKKKRGPSIIRRDL